MRLRDLLRDVLTEEEMKYAPSAFDAVGDIAIIWIPDELKAKEKEIGEKLLTFKNIKTVLEKDSAVEDEFRVRKYKYLAGEKKTETIYIEYGRRYKVDVTKAYFSPRLGNERERIVKQVKEDEKVLVMFSGIGPYAIQIAKRAKPSIVYAVEINPEGCRYAEENIRLNKVGDLVKNFCGDVREIVPKLAKSGKIVEICELHGPYVAALKISADSLAEIREEIVKIRKIPDVTRTEMITIFKIWKTT